MTGMPLKRQVSRPAQSHIFTYFNIKITHFKPKISDRLYCGLTHYLN